jgi:hypothetical protein
MARLCPVCGRVHKYDNMECIRRRSLPDNGEALDEIDKLKERIKNLEA